MDGTPVVSRIPYDNKQCKAYKALKIKYASVIKDPDAEYGYVVNSWENDSDFTSNANPLIDLDTVGSYINPEGEETLYETLSKQEISTVVTVSGKSEIIKLLPDEVKDITYNEVFYSLNDNLRFQADLENDDATDLFNKIQNSINSIKNYLKIASHPDRSVSGVIKLDSWKALTSALIEFETEVTNDTTSAIICNTNIPLPSGIANLAITGLTDLEEKLSKQPSGTALTFNAILGGENYNFYDGLVSAVSPNSKVSAYLALPVDERSLSGFVTFSTELPLSSIADKYKDYLETTLSSAIVKPTDNKFKSTSSSISGDFIAIFGNQTFEKYLDIQNEIVTKYYTEYIKAKKGGTVGNVITDANQMTEAFEKLENYITAKTQKHNLTLSGISNLITDGIFTKVKDTALSSIQYTSGGFNTGITFVDILSTYQKSGYTSITDYADFSAVSSLYDISKLGTISALPYMFEVYPSGVISSWIDIFKSDINQYKIDQLTKGDSATGLKLLINGEDPADLNIAEEALTPYMNGGGYFNILSGLSNTVISTPVSGLTAQQKAFDKALAAIYNDPYFKKVANNETQKQQAVIDAHLLKTPEIGFEKAVYLDSTDCVISNEQYDDLVTAGTFTKADPSVSKYGEDIDTANFVIVDKNKSIVAGTGSNEGYFVTIIDPYDALKSQRMLVNPNASATNINLNMSSTLADYAVKSKYNWKLLFKNEINTLNALQHVTNADGLLIGELTDDKYQLLDAWSTPLAADYYNESISKTLMNLYPQIPLADSNQADSLCTIDKMYSSHIVVAVCKTIVNPSDGKITVSVVEQFFGSLFNEKSATTGVSLYIGDAINTNSNYIEFYRNDYVKPAFSSGFDPAPYDRTAVPQFYINNSAELNNQCAMIGIDTSLYDVDNKFFDANGNRKEGTPASICYTYKQYTEDLKKNNIFVFNKKTTIVYNNNPAATLISFSKKEAQKIIANTTSLFGSEEGTTMNIASNFILDMDRCINFIKNIDQIPIYFVADAGLSTIAQFCDNVVWDEFAKKWVTQQFDPDHDPDSDDRYITDANSVSTWRKVVDKLDQISREIRRDCLTIIDAPRMLTLDGSAQKIRASRPQNSWDELVGEKLRYISGINSSYTAGYYNWLRTTDEFSGTALWLPPTCKIIGNYMYLNTINLPWLAPAGINYGSIQGIHGISHNPSPSEEDQIYLKSWNYVKQYPFDGFVIEGQKTTLTKNSAFNRVNVRTLFLDLERFVSNVARNYRYTVNNSYTREQFVHALKAKFEDYTLRHGIYDYMIICDETNNTPETIDANELRCAIYIKPARLIEFVLVDFIAAKTGANFAEITL